MNKNEVKVHLAIWFIEWIKEDNLNNCNHKHHYDETEELFNSILDLLKK